MQPQIQPQIQISRRKISQILSKRPPLPQIKQIHAQIITQSLGSHSRSLIDSLIHCYLHSENLIFARALFDSYPLNPPTLLWNLMIRAYSKLRDSSDSISLFCRMLSSSSPPDDRTFNSVITSSARQESVLFGLSVHSMAIKNGYCLNLYVANPLLNMYGVFAMVDNADKVFDEMPVKDVFSWTTLLAAHAKHGTVQKAEELFEQMPQRNNVSWAVIISGFVSRGMFSEAIRYFDRMLSEIRPNEAVLVSAISACAHLGSLDHGNRIHGYINANGIPETSNIRTALIDMYAKCGTIDQAYQVFNAIATPNIQNFSSLISGLSIHGLGEEAVRVFRRMLIKSMRPNEITILGVLNGCSHAGLVQSGTSIFYNMENRWGITPGIEHYGCYIDLLSRAGYLAKAFSIVKRMPMSPDDVVWRALLSACRIHRNAGFGERIMRYSEYSGGDVLLSNTFASVGKWENVARLRDMMEDDKRRSRSNIGCSWIETNGVVHEFRVAEKLHPRIEETRGMLLEILERVRRVGYAIDATRVSFDLSDEDREHATAWHSEKLAVAFGILDTRPGDTIRIAKNLRSCEDCHAVFKAISQVYEREIVVRDRARFHVFRDGKCLCNDYW
ncbi:pentatricopeptide repeat-containing protein At5g66520-like [Andrographis paniculata]|uniref:pentatricopeptide repeat-containing protein At5g66520-like n=1 Tax=Andrographis paniculata TaxID=175694 RepID=UPI0021E958E8|nr:pentatricopeptide repeat-containing protein At5g66520-like [Andrographis paniculata]